MYVCIQFHFTDLIFSISWQGSPRVPGNQWQTGDSASFPSPVYTGDPRTQTESDTAPPQPQPQPQEDTSVRPAVRFRGPDRAGPRHASRGSGHLRPRAHRGRHSTGTPRRRVGVGPAGCGIRRDGDSAAALGDSRR